MLDYDQLLVFVRDGCGLHSRDEAERVTRTVLSALGDFLAKDVLEIIARELPPSAAQALRTGAKRARFDRDEFFARVARREKVDEGFGLEHAEVVCAGIGSALPQHIAARLSRELPPEAANLFSVIDDRTNERPSSLPARVPRTTLAEGRPTSSRPLSESVPPRAQLHSVVNEANPHADTKLSSSSGLTQESLAETLATGRPGPKRPISGG